MGIDIFGIIYMKNLNYHLLLIGCFYFLVNNINLEKKLNESNRNVFTYCTTYPINSLDAEIKVNWTCTRCGSNNADYTLTCCQCDGSR